MNISDLEFPENTIIIDVSYLNKLILGLKSLFEESLQRKLDTVKVYELLNFMALDMGINPGKNEIMVIWVYDDESKKIEYTIPSDIESKLNQMGFKDLLGTFTMFGAPTKGLTQREELFMNVIQLVHASEEVKRIGILPQENVCDAELEKLLKDTDKDVSIFEVVKDEKKMEQCMYPNPLYPIMQALGIKGEDID